LAESADSWDTFSAKIANFCPTVSCIYSATRDKYYVGSCEDVNKRLVKHNTNHSGFTGKTLDWEIKWTEEHATKTDALKREKQIKPGKVVK